MNIYSSKRLSVASRHSPRFPLEQKRREHIQEALVKETVLNNGVAGTEQRGVLSIGRDVCYTTVICTQLYKASNGHSTPEEDREGEEALQDVSLADSFLPVRNRLY